jgi:hypothetical protein
MNLTYYVKINGKVNIPTELSIGHNYELRADCSIVGESKDDNENGEYSVTYKLVPVTADITKANGEVVKAKDPRKNSQKMRNYLFKNYFDEGIIEDFDLIYDAFTYEVMAMTPQLLREAVKRVQKK